MSRGITWIEIKLLAREPLTLVVGLAFPVVLMLLLLVSFGSEPDAAFDGVGGTDFYVPSYLGAAIAVMGFLGVPTHIAAYRDSGVLRRFRAAGVSAGSIMISQLAVTAVLASFGGMVMIALAYFGFELRAPIAPWAVVTGFALGLLAFSAIGVLLGSVLPSARAAQGTGLLLFFGTFFLVGGGPPPAILPDSLNTAVEFTPIAQLADAIRSPWVGLGWDTTALVALAAMTVVAAVLAQWRLSRI